MLQCKHKVMVMVEQGRERLTGFHVKVQVHPPKPIQSHISPSVHPLNLHGVTTPHAVLLAELGADKRINVAVSPEPHLAVWIHLPHPQMKLPQLLGESGVGPRLMDDFFNHSSSGSE